MTIPFLIRWCSALVALAGAAAFALNQPSTSQESDGQNGRIAIASKAPGLMTVIDLKDHAPREFKVGYLPHEAAAFGSLVFLSNYGSGHVRSSDLTNDPGNTLSVIDLSHPQAATEIVELGPGRCAPHGLAVSRDGQRLYVTCEGRQEVVAVDLKTRKVLHAIPTNQAGSHMLVLSADGSRAYVTNFWHGTVSVLDLQARRILSQITTGSGTEGIGLSPDGRYVYTSSVYINEIVKIDTNTLQVTERARMSNCLGAVRVIPTPVDGGTLVVNCADNGRVLIVDAGTLRVRHQIPVGTLPIGIAVPNDRYAYVANMADDTISIIDIRKAVVVRTIPAGDDPDGVVFLPDSEAK